MCVAELYRIVHTERLALLMEVSECERFANDESSLNIAFRQGVFGRVWTHASTDTSPSGFSCFQAPCVCVFCART